MAATSTGMTRLESFPFDSKADGYDSEGYPVYDRAVGASMLRETFAKFFTNGIFPSPGTALNIGKADTGLAVTIQPGIGIINGSMGGVTGDDALKVTLDTAAPQGNVCYGIMLRFDNTGGFADSRSLLINVVRSDAATSPTPPEPDTTTPQVFELRLGYVTVPSGATDLSAATVTNEKGLEACPYAAPFVEIDTDAVVADAKASAEESLAVFSEMLATYYDLVQSAVDGTTAGNLQNQIDELKGAGLSEESVDGVTIAYEPTTASGGVDKLQVKTGGIGTKQLADGSVTVEKLDGVVEAPPSGASNGYILSSNGTSAQWSSLNNLLSGNITELWSGSGASSLTVPGIQNYSMFYFKVQLPGSIDGCAFGLLIPGTNTVFGSGSTIYSSNSSPNGVVISMDVSENQASDIHVTIYDLNRPNWLVGIYGVM